MKKNENSYKKSGVNIPLANKLVEHTPEEAKAVIVADPEVVKKAVKEDFTRILDNSASWTDMWTKWKST